MKLVLIGIQGSGKSTQGNFLSKQLDIPYLSTGHIFREIAKGKTKLASFVKLVMTSGRLIPDDKTIEIVNSYLSRPEYRKGYILDGFPRTLDQAKKFKNHVDKVILLEVPDREALWRLSHRVTTEKRDDDTLAALRQRIELFHQSTGKVIEYYEKHGKLISIDGTKDIRSVNTDILNSLGKKLVKNKIKDWKKDHKTLIAIVGMNGSGKTESADFFRKKKLPVISFGDILNEKVNEMKLPQTEEIHRKMRNDIRKEHGIEGFAVLNIDKIKKAFDDNMTVVVDGLRSWEEYLYLKKQLPDVNIYILALYADKSIRYERIKQRKNRNKLYGEDRDLHELIETNMGPAIAYADFMIKNNYSLEDLHDKLEHIYRVIYYS
ncbi:MAG: nucleoside monophosphate kinase [bacterium]|nr:nucleoside monophosphate kinase [bacterium]